MNAKNVVESGLHTFLISVLCGGLIGALCAGGVSGVFGVETTLYQFLVEGRYDSSFASVVLLLIFWLALCLVLHLPTRTEKSIVVVRVVMTSIYVLASVASGVLLRVFAIYSSC